MVKLKTFKFGNDEISHLSSLARELGLSESDAIRLSLILLTHWVDGEFDYKMKVPLPLVHIKRESGKRESYTPFYLVEKGKVTFGGFENPETELKNFSASKKNHKNFIKQLILRENELNTDKIVSYKIIN